MKPILKLASRGAGEGPCAHHRRRADGNVPRVLPKGTKAVIDKKSVAAAGVFSWLQRTGNVAEDEMFRVFNCGIGMVIVVAPRQGANARPCS